HRVPLRRLEAYLKFMEKDGLGLLKKHGFHPVGPFLTAVGRWSEVTYLFRFDSLAERDRLIAAFSAHADGRSYSKVAGFTDALPPRLLVPTFPKANPDPEPHSELLPHLEHVAPGVHAAGFADRYRDANCGWVALPEETLLIDLPRGVPVPAFLAEVARLAGKPARKLALTSLQPDDLPLGEELGQHGITQGLTSPPVRNGPLAGRRA